MGLLTKTSQCSSKRVFYHTMRPKSFTDSISEPILYVHTAASSVMSVFDNFGLICDVELARDYRDKIHRISLSTSSGEILTL